MDDEAQERPLRYITWPLAAFLIGFLLSPPPVRDPPPEPVYILLLSFAAGCICAGIGFVAAFFMDSSRGPTKTAIPFADGEPGPAILFTLCFIAAVGMKTFGYWSLLTVILGGIPILSVMRGGAPRDVPDPSIYGDPINPLKWRPNMRLPDMRWLVGLALLAAWGAFCWFRYKRAEETWNECIDVLPGAQAAICVRHAIEARDAVITWGIGLPLLLMGGAATVVWTVKQIRNDRPN